MFVVGRARSNRVGLEIGRRAFSKGISSETSRAWGWAKPPAYAVEAQETRIPVRVVMLRIFMVCLLFDLSVRRECRGTKKSLQSHEKTATQPPFETAHILLFLVVFATRERRSEVAAPWRDHPRPHGRHIASSGRPRSTRARSPDRRRGCRRRGRRNRRS